MWNAGVLGNVLFTVFADGTRAKWHFSKAQQPTAQLSTHGVSGQQTTAYGLLHT